MRDISAASIFQKYQNIELMSIHCIDLYHWQKYQNFQYIGIKFLIYHLAEFSFIHSRLKKPQQQTMKKTLIHIFVQ